MFKIVYDYFNEKYFMKEISSEQEKEFFEYLKESETKHKTWPDIKFYLGLYYLRKGLKSQGLRKLKEALKINPKYVKVKEVQAFIQERDSGKGIDIIKDLVREHFIKGETKNNLLLTDLIFQYTVCDKAQIKSKMNFSQSPDALLLFEIMNEKFNITKINQLLKKFTLQFGYKKAPQVKNEVIPKLQEHIKDYLKNEFLYAQYYLKLGNYLLEALELEGARLCFEKSVLAFPDYANYFLNLSNIEYHKDKIKLSKEHLYRALNFDRNYSKIYSVLGSLNGYCGDYKEAEKNLLKAISLNPNFPDRHFNLGLLYSDLGEPKKAIKYFKYALKINPLYNLALINLGRAYFDTGENKKAVGIFEKCLAQDLKFPEVYYYLGSLNLKLKRLDKGLNYLKLAMKSDPEYPNPIADLCLYYLKNDIETARTYFKKLKELGFETMIPAKLRRKFK